MKPPRTPRPAPRTLAATPPPMLRTPQTSQRVAVFPSLAIVLAGGAAVSACHDPQCGATRADELESHGRSSVGAIESGRIAEALREIRVAMGVSAHPEETSVGNTGGVPMPVNPLPPVVPPPRDVIPPSGGVMGVTPTPPPVVPPQPHTTTQQPDIPRPGSRMPVAPHPPRDHQPHRTTGATVTTGPTPPGIEL